MQNVEMLKSTRFEQTGIENCGLYTVKTLAGGCVVGVNNVKKWRIYAFFGYFNKNLHISSSLIP